MSDNQQVSKELEIYKQTQELTITLCDKEWAVDDIKSITHLSKNPRILYWWGKARAAQEMLFGHEMHDIELAYEEQMQCEDEPSDCSKGAVEELKSVVDKMSDLEAADILIIINNKR